MKRFFILTAAFFLLLTGYLPGQTLQDSLGIKQAALDYIESQHQGKPEQFERSATPEW